MEEAGTTETAMEGCGETNRPQVGEEKRQQSERQNDDMISRMHQFVVGIEEVRNDVCEALNAPLVNETLEREDLDAYNVKHVSREHAVKVNHVHAKQMNVLEESEGIKLMHGPNNNKAQTVNQLVTFPSGLGLNEANEARNNSCGLDVNVLESSERCGLEDTTMRNMDSSEAGREDTLDETKVNNTVTSTFGMGLNEEDDNRSRLNEKVRVSSGECGTEVVAVQGGPFDKGGEDVQKVMNLNQNVLIPNVVKPNKETNRRIDNY